VLFAFFAAMAETRRRHHPRLARGVERHQATRARLEQLLSELDVPTLISGPRT
jgi:hypothetical protein